MNRIFKLFSSSALALLLLLSFAISMAIATFIENDFGTATAQKIIYKAIEEIGLNIDDNRKPIVKTREDKKLFEQLL